MARTQKTFPIQTLIGVARVLLTVMLNIIRRAGRKNTKHLVNCHQDQESCVLKNVLKGHINTPVMKENCEVRLEGGPTKV